MEKIINDPVAYANSITIKRLVTILTKMSDYYYSNTEPLVDDDTYDLMLDVLKERDENNSFLFQTGTTIKEDDDIELPFGMPSLNKIKPGERSLELWFDKYPGPYVISDKLDGISIQIYKDSNGDVDIFTKKRMDIGTSKKHIMKYLLSDKLMKKVPNNTSIRGEIVITKKNFKKFSKDYKNTRNIISIINSKHIDTRVLEKLDIVAYGILSPTMSISDQVKQLKKWGFNTVWNKLFDINEFNEGKYDNDKDVEYQSESESDEEAEDAAESEAAKSEEDTVDNDEEYEYEYEEEELPLIDRLTTKLKGIFRYRRTCSPYDCDGIVIFDNSKVYEHINDRNPPHAMAFKFNVDMKEVNVVKVKWDISKHGLLKPVVVIEPVDIRGVTITNVTAHNAKNVYDNNIGKGSILKISRSGDVIPKIEKVIKKSKKPDMPGKEGEDWEWNSTNVDIFVSNPTGDLYDTMNIKRILNFFNKLNVKYLSDGLMKILYNNDYNTIIKVLEAAHKKDETPYDFEGLGKTMMTKIYAQIDKAMNKKVNAGFMAKLMSGSLVFGQGIGERKLKDLIKGLPEVLDSKKKKKELKADIMELDGFSEITAKKIVDGIKPFNKFLKKINKYYDVKYETNTDTKTKNVKNVKGAKDSKDNIKTKSKYDLTKVVLTGFRDKDGTIEAYIEENDGSLVSGVSKKTTLIVVDDIDSTSSKVTKGRENGIKIISKDEFMKLIK